MPALHIPNGTRIIGRMPEPLPQTSSNVKDAEVRARRIKVLLFDVDGVLTDGGITVMPGPDGKAIEVKTFSAHDGMGIALAHTAGLRIGWVTKRDSQAVGHSAQHPSVKDEGCTLDEIAYVGDDIIDLPVMRKVGLAIAVANARPEVKAMAHYTTEHPGGFGGGRDAIDLLLRSRGVLESTIERYLDPEDAEAKNAHIGVGNM